VEIRISRVGILTTPYRQVIIFQNTSSSS